MRILITGAGGGLGAALVQTLIARGNLCGQAITALGLCNPIMTSSPRAPFEVKTFAVEAARRNPLDEALAHGWNVIFHCEMGTARRAEADFVAGMRTTFFAGLNVVEAARATATKPMIVIASTTFAQPDTPLISTGAQHRIVETLAADYGRRGFIDARVLRVADVIAPRQPGAAFEISDLISSPLQAAPVLSPLPNDAALNVLSAEHAANALITLAEAEAAQPMVMQTASSLPITVAELTAALSDDERALIDQDESLASPPLSPAPDSNDQAESAADIVAATRRALTTD